MLEINIIVGKVAMSQVLSSRLYLLTPLEVGRCYSCIHFRVESESWHLAQSGVQ